jgi:hypothetical protein
MDQRQDAAATFGDWLLVFVSRFRKFAERRRNWMQVTLKTGHFREKVRDKLEQNC